MPNSTSSDLRLKCGCQRGLPVAGGAVGVLEVPVQLATDEGLEVVVAHLSEMGEVRATRRNQVDRLAGDQYFMPPSPSLTV